MTPNAESRLRSTFYSLADIPDLEWRYFWPLVRERRFSNRQHLLYEGKPATDIYFILSGLVRLYHNQDGRELVRGFDYEDRFVTAYESVLTGAPATYSVQALEPTQALTFPGDLLLAMYDRHPSWDRLGRRLLESHMVRQADKERRFRVYGPEEHYRLLIERGSPLVERVPLNQLASYFRITPETLSRIRSRLKESQEPSGREPAT